MSRICLAELPRAQPFRPVDPAGPTEVEPVVDAIQVAFDRGFAEGLQEGQSRKELASTQESELVAQLSRAVERVQAEELSLMQDRLMATVEALCEDVMTAHLANPEHLAARVERAVALFRRAKDERCVRLNPDDYAMLKPVLPAQISVEPDPAIGRGNLRIETPEGGVEDGLDVWRQRLAELLHQGEVA